MTMTKRRRRMRMMTLRKKAEMEVAAVRMAVQAEAVVGAMTAATMMTIRVFLLV
jgi:hypothetical protein